MRVSTLMVSVLLHAGLAALAARIPPPAPRRPTWAVTILDTKPPAPPVEALSPPPPTPAPPPAPSPAPKAAPPTPKPAPSGKRPPATSPRAAPPAASPPATAPAARALDSGLTLGNGGAGGGTGAGIGPSAAAKSSSGEAPAAKESAKVLGAREEAACDAAPTKPKPIERPREIDYPEEARKEGLEGRLVLELTIGADGRVVEVRVTSPVAPALDAAAVAAVKTWRFQPAERCGRPVSATYTLARRFELGD